MELNPIQNQQWPEDGLERVDSCPVCGTKARTLLHKGLTDRVFFCAPGEWTLYSCDHCHSAYLDPRPNLATIALAYQNYYTHNQDENISNGKIAHLKRSLRNSYINYTYNSRLHPEIKLGYFIVMLFTQKRKEIDERLRHLPNNIENGIVLDIGCGNGQFLKNALELGWEAWGIDQDPLAVETAKKTGARVIQGGLPDTGLPSSYFDVVTLSHVLEHVYDPLAALKESYRLLKPGGLIWIATPNQNSYGHAQFAGSWRGIEPPRHLVIFTTNSLIKLLRSANFTKINHKPCRKQANEFYKNSHMIKNEKSKKLPISLRYRAAIANFKTIFNPAGCENIILTGVRPSPKYITNENLTK